jgi:hypothetical protein
MKTEAEFRVTEITENHVQTVKQLISDNPSWNRKQAVKGTLPILELALSYGPDKGYGLPGSFA